MEVEDISVFFKNEKANIERYGMIGKLKVSHESIDRFIQTVDIQISLSMDEKITVSMTVFEALELCKELKEKTLMLIQEINTIKNELFDERLS